MPELICMLLRQELSIQTRLPHKYEEITMKKWFFMLINTKKPFEAIIASASIPLFFGTTYIDEEAYVDGGLVDNNPIDVLIEKGCNVILAVPLDTQFDVRPYLDKNVLIVNFTDLSVFSSTLIQDAYDIIRFTDDALTERQNYGYLVAKEVIESQIIRLFKKGHVGI